MLLLKDAQIPLIKQLLTCLYVSENLVHHGAFFFFCIFQFDWCLYNIISFNLQLSNEKIRGEIIILIL